MVDFSIFFAWPDTHNTLIVLFSVLVMSVACTSVGCFVVLNRQALIADVASHATVPGVAIGFFLTVLLAIDNDASAMAVILLCAGAFGALGVYCVDWISRYSCLKPDVAMGSVLSVFYGFGLVLFSMIQRVEGVRVAGLDQFLLGQVTGITTPEAVLILTLSGLALGGVVLMFRGLRWLCFDPLYLQAHCPRFKLVLNRVMVFLILLIICAGLRTVGVVLFVALMIIPVCALQIWQARVSILAVSAGIFGLVACYMGVQISAHHNHVPAGAAIVLCCAGLFCISVIAAHLLHLGQKVHKG